MKTAIIIINAILSVVIVVSILTQGRGAGLGSAWGGGGETFQTRRGVELVVMRLTVLCIVLFFIFSAVALLIK